MKNYSLNLLEKVNNEIGKIESEESSISNKSIRIIELLEKSYTELKVYISKYTFSTDSDEIYFFKEIKPLIFSKIIFYNSIFKFEMNRPTGNNSVQKDYTLKRLDKLKDFFDSNVEFYRYYRAKRTDLDKHYFMRGKAEIHFCFDSYYFDRDPNFSTGFDFMISRILANDKLSHYLNEELLKLEQIPISQFEIPSFPASKQTWTDSKVALVELIYAIHTTGSIDFGKYDLKHLALYFENVFNIELGDIYHTYHEIRERKGNRVQYLDELRKNLIDRMDDTDNP